MCSGVLRQVVSSREDTAVTVAKIKPRDIEGYYQYERTEKNALNTALLQYHEVIKEALAYVVELELIRDNPADKVNPISGEVRILFTDFLLEWLEMIKHNVEMTTYASYAVCIKSCIIPYFENF